jgi:hypothetical protein
MNRYHRRYGTEPGKETDEENTKSKSSVKVGEEMIKLPVIFGQFA